MDTYDRLIEILLTFMDRILNALSLGLWERWQGRYLVRPYYRPYRK